MIAMKFISHRMLSQEIDQLKVMAIVLPGVFLGVSAFLLSVLMNRINRHSTPADRRAQGFRLSKIFDLAVYFGLLTGLIVAVGLVLGVVIGMWAGDAMAELYAEYFRFPETVSRFSRG